MKLKTFIEAVKSKLISIEYSPMKSAFNVLAYGLLLLLLIFKVRDEAGYFTVAAMVIFVTEMVAFRLQIMLHKEKYEYQRLAVLNLLEKVRHEIRIYEDLRESDKEKKDAE